MLRDREDAIVASVNRLLVEKGFDLMTVDEVAADVGIAKASLYKHFDSKEALAAAAMVRILDLALAVVEAENAQPEPPAIERVKAMLRWTLETQLAGEMPTLPSENSTLRATLMGNKDYIDRLMRLSDALGEWIVQAQADGALSRALPPEVVLYTLYAKACDPVLGFLRAGGQYDDQQLVEWLIAVCVNGLAGA